MSKQEPLRCVAIVFASIDVFLYRYMPALESFFHYRHLDVSTLKILAQCWAPDMLSKTQKKSQHIAMADIKDSIEELQYYAKHFIDGKHVPDNI